jgi:hypothetical protein
MLVPGTVCLNIAPSPLLSYESFTLNFAEIRLISHSFTGQCSNFYQIAVGYKDGGGKFHLRKF